MTVHDSGLISAYDKAPAVTLPEHHATVRDEEIWKRIRDAAIDRADRPAMTRSEPR